MNTDSRDVDKINPLRVIIKGVVLFFAFNILFALWNPGFANLSGYNRLFPGRKRLPFGENASRAYNLSLYNLDAMFASHIIAAGTKPAGEFRIILIGDSSVWGILLKPEETLAGQLNANNLTVCGKSVRAYNLGYPTISLTKDLIILARALDYQPDLILWLTTLEAFPLDKQLTSPIVANNPQSVRDLTGRFRLGFNAYDPAFSSASLWDQMLIGQRRNLADLFRLQFYGILWAATGIDQVYPVNFPPAQVDLESDTAFHDIKPPVLDPTLLALQVLDAGFRLAGDVPVILVNEPMLISTGENSNIRYNYFYPRWAYDQYRQLMLRRSQQSGWRYLDLWDLLPAGEFTNSAIHLTPAGEVILARRLESDLVSVCK
jgi:hypothetical protein